MTRLDDSPPPPSAWTATPAILASPRWQKRITTSTPSKYVVVGVVAASVTLLYAASTLFMPSSSSSTRTVVTPHSIDSASWSLLASRYRGELACDPFARPGVVAFNESSPSDTTWIPFSSTCAPSLDYLSALTQLQNLTMFDNDDTLWSQLTPQSGHVDQWGRPLPDLTFLKGKTVLVLGDSVDRNSLLHLHEILGVNVRGMDYLNVTAGIPQGWDSRGVPWSLRFGLKEAFGDWWDGGGWIDGMKHPNRPDAHFAGLNMEIVNGFFYGLDDRDEFSVQGDWHSPGLAEDRVLQLFVPMLQQLSSKFHNGEGPSFISLHSGLWDLAFFGRRARQTNTSTSTPLNHEDLKWWMSRMSNLIQLLQRTFPNTPIWLRLVHRIGEERSASLDWSSDLRHKPNPNPNGFTNFFTDIRVHQIREMQIYVAKSLGIPIFDFGQLWEGFQHRQDKVHPFQDPAGQLIGQAMFHHVWMESIGRQHWNEESLRDIGPLPHPTL